jgi:hypothetical protein
LELAIVDSEHELKLVYNARPDKRSMCLAASVKKGFKMYPFSVTYWLGASDIGQQPGDFRWMDGWKVYKGMWASGDPNDHGQGNETCVNFFDAKLLDSPCHYVRNYVCKVGEIFEKCV